MQFFRGFVIGTLNFVAFLFFILTIVYSGWAGWNGAFTDFLADAQMQAGVTDVDVTGIPAWGGAIIGVVVGWLAASISLGILFVLIDIQDGIRDLHRDLTKKDTTSTTAV